MFIRAVMIFMSLSFISPHLINAQQGTITGKVRMGDGTKLPGVRISVENTSASTITDQNGIYIIKGILPGERIICASLEGFKEKKITTFIPSGQTSVVDFTLELMELTEETMVTAERPLLSTSEEVSKIILTPTQIAALPSLGEKDIFRAFQLLPGISGSNEASSGLYIRGGTPDQNLVMYDGFTIYHVDHLFGYYSAFNMEAVREVQLSKGGFGAKYGGRLSSVMELYGKTGEIDNFNFGAGLSMISFNGLAEIPLFKKGSLFLAGRRSFQSPLYESIMNMFNETPGRPTIQGRGGGGRSGGRGGMFDSQPSSHFYDLNAKMLFHLSSRDDFYLSFYNGKDNLDNSRILSMPSFMAERGIQMEGDITDLTEWGNTGMSANWAREWGRIFSTKLTAAYSNYFNNRDRTSSISITVDPEIEPPPKFEGRNLERGSVEENDLDDMTLRLDNTLDLNENNRMEFGLQITSNDIRYNYDVDDSGDDGRMPGDPRRLVGVLDREGQATQYSAYIQDRWTLFDRIIFTPGFRMTYYDLTKKYYYEPRLSLNFRLNSKIQLKTAFGRYHQFANKITREDILQGNREFWSLADEQSIPVGMAYHYIAGISYETNIFLFDIEVYHKDLSGLSEFAPRFTPTSEDIDYNQFFFTGTGIAQGIEFLLQKKFGKYTGWLSYTLGKVEYNFPDLEEEAFPALHDQTHEFKLVSMYDINNWTFSGTFIYATGKPYTEPIGTEDIELLNGRIVERVVVGQKNGARLPAYHRLDLAVTYNFSFGDADTSSAGMSVFNVYDQKNVWYKEFDIIEGEIIENNINLMNLTFNLFLRIKF